MAVSLTHTTVAVGTDAGNGEIAKAQWNENHTLTAAVDNLLGTTSLSTSIVEIPCTAAGRALLDDVDASAQRTTLGLGTGNSPSFTGLTLSGVGAFSAGSASVPSIIPSGDTNTGMWFPAADTIAWSTNGSERMRVRSDGNIGIGGTGSAATSLSIQKAITGGTTAVGADLVTTVQSDVTTQGLGYNTTLATQATTFTTNIQHYRAGQGIFGAGSTVSAQYGFNGTGSLIGATANFSFFASDTAAVTTGKTSYGFYSAINTATGGGTTWGFYAAGTAPNYFAGQVQLAAGSAGTPSLSAFGDTNTGMWYPAADTVAFSVGGAEQMRINATGVGINTNSPEFFLDVTAADNVTTTTAVSIQNSARNYGLGLGAYQLTNRNIGGAATNVDYTFDIGGNAIFRTNNSEAMRIDTLGEVGIGVTPVTKLDLNGNYASNIVAVAALDINCSAGNYFTKTINANSTFTFSNAPSSRSFSFTLELTHTSGTVTWPAAVKWPGDTAPTLTTGKTHLFMFVTDDAGTRWRGASLTNYTN